MMGRQESAVCRAAWDMTEGAALAQLERFIAVGLREYEAKRSVATGAAVSRLSPYIHFGQLSPRHMMRALDGAGCRDLSKTFWRRLVWRDLAYWQLHHWPRMPTVPMRAAYEDQEWTTDAAALRAWQRGRTGFPLVDAGMRELWATGYMHQNVRIVVACFLTEYLNQHWVHGARWFHDALVDGDLAINCMMWQNAGKSGLDQWNFTSTPTGGSSDRNGEYVRKCAPAGTARPDPVGSVAIVVRSARAVRAQVGAGAGEASEQVHSCPMECAHRDAGRRGRAPRRHLPAACHHGGSDRPAAAQRGGAARGACKAPGAH